MKRKADDDPSSGTLKHIKIEKDDTAASYSQDVKKKISASARTGQACDRCRVRKMRCDDQLNGCAPCTQNQSECKTTDRITGKATVRGYVQSLEQQLEELQRRNRELESRLMSLGEDAKPYTVHGDPATPPLVRWHEDQRSGHGRPWEGRDDGFDVSKSSGSERNGTKTNGPGSNTVGDYPPRLPDFRSGLAGNNYLGVSTGNNLLSSIEGTSMTVLGMEIDLADYMSADVDEPDPSLPGTPPVYNKSYRAFVQTAFGTSPKLHKVELPPKSEGINYANVFFRVTNPYLPVVHKPSFMKTLTRIYDDPTFEPSVAETVMVHTMFAIMHSQYASRAAQNVQHQAELTHSSNFHYHYALGFFAKLVASHTLADVQALTMLCLHNRNSPKPGACWMIASIVLDLAIELGLHRSAKRWAPTTKRSMLEIEMRKRTFWTILSIHATISGNLGRPVALRPDDWDVEMPEAIDDELLSEDGLDTSRPGVCNFLVGAHIFPVIPIYMDLLSNIYAVRRSPDTYIETVHRIQRRIDDWQKKWPPELKNESAANNELGRVHYQYLAIWRLHILLLLRHPSLSLATEPEFNNENLTVCMDVSREMLHHVKQIQKYKSLDGTWQTGSLYVLALATSLFGHWERREQVNSSDLASLKDDMEAWLSIIGEMSNILGSGRRIQDAVRVPVDRTIGLLAQHIASKTPIHVSTSTAQKQVPCNNVPSTPSSATSAYQINNYEAYNAPPKNGMTHSQAGPPQVPPAKNVPARAANQYPDPQYSYQGPYANNASTYVSPPYTSSAELPATAQAANAYLNGYRPQPTPMNPNFHSSLSNTNYTQYHSPGSPTSWRTWAGSMASNLEPGAEYMSSASALMQLGGRSEGSGSHDMPVDGTNGQMWPFMLFDSGTGGGHQ